MSAGYFIDWDGNVRSVSDPGGGYRCEGTSAPPQRFRAPGMARCASSTRVLDAAEPSPDLRRTRRAVKRHGGRFASLPDVDTAARYVAIATPVGTLVHEATLYRSLEDVARAGIKASLVPGSQPWGERNDW
jgi:hypothetical protein